MININYNDLFDKEQLKKNANQALKDKGFDELNRVLLVLIIIGLIIDIFFKIMIIGILDILFIIIFLLRIFDKNTYRRVKQNRIFIEFISIFKEPFRKIVRFFKKNSKPKSNKNNIYKKCPKCGLTLKLPLPKKRGIKHTTCPDCGTRFGFLALKVRKDR
ncbi:MAG: hypothetical protein Q4E69_05450 [Bacilli bacterium]|nr:hypothetical protein [Bacilli bacterium]